MLRLHEDRSVLRISLHIPHCFQLLVAPDLSRIYTCCNIRLTCRVTRELRHFSWMKARDYWLWSSRSQCFPYLSILGWFCFNSSRNTSQHVAVLQFLGFPRAGFHHLTTAPQTGIFLHFEDIDTCQVQIHKDNIGVLICGETNSLTVYDWKTGRTRAVRISCSSLLLYPLSHHYLKQYAPIGRESITAFSFLTPNAIVTTNLSTLQIELWILTDSKMFQTGSLGLPAIRPGIAVEGLDCTPLSPDQFLDPQFSPVITFNLLMCKDTPRGSTSYCLVKFVVNTATLFDLGFSDVGPSKRGFKRHFPWAVWGPQATRCFDGSCAVDDCNRGGQYFVSLSDAECTEPYKLSIYDFGRAKSLRNVQKLEPRFNCQELQHISVFQEDVYTLMPRSLLLYQVVAPSDRILVDRDRVFAFKVCARPFRETQVHVSYAPLVSPRRWSSLNHVVLLLTCDLFTGVGSCARICGNYQAS